MPRQDEIFTALTEVIHAEFNPAGEALVLKPETPLFNGGLELDSFAVVELIAQLESKLSFEFKEGDFRQEHFRTLGSLSGLIERYVGS